MAIACTRVTHRDITASQVAATTAGPDAGHVKPNALMWINSRDIPMDSFYHWGSLAASAHPVTSPLFAFEQACGSTPDPWRSNIEQSGYTAFSAPFGNGGTDWQGLQLIVRPPGDSDASIDAARGMFNLLDIELTQGCPTAPNGAHAVVPWTGDSNTPVPGYTGLAAVITGGPATELHDYLMVAHCPNHAAVSELALWASQPSHPWPVPPPAQVLAAMTAAMCSSDIE